MRKYLLVLVILLLSACNHLDTFRSEGSKSESPRMWINYQGDRYVFEEVYLKNEIKIEDITPTNSLTGKDDGVQSNKKIYIDKKNGDLYIIDDSGSEEQWVRFIKK